RINHVIARCFEKSEDLGGDPFFPWLLLPQIEVPGGGVAVAEKGVDASADVEECAVRLVEAVAGVEPRLEGSRPVVEHHQRAEVRGSVAQRRPLLLDVGLSLQHYDRA